MAHVFALGQEKGLNLADAAELAPRVARHIYEQCCLLMDGRWQYCAWSAGEGNVPKPACYGYDHDLVRSFQMAAGLDVDGLYGPESRGALIFFGVARPPPALYGSGTVAYTPPTVAPAPTPEPTAPPPPEEAPVIPVVPPVAPARRPFPWAAVVAGVGGAAVVVWWLVARRRRR